MMPSLVGTNMVGLPHHQASGGAYTVDSILNELSRQLIGNTRRYSRASNTQQRGGSAMRISKPGSANNSPRSSTLQARRRTLVGDGFRPGLQTQSPAMDQIYLPQLAPETPNESLYERQTTRPARPVSWHPSSQNTQESLYAQQDAILYPYSTYSDAEVLASLQHFPPTPAVYSGYASPAESFSPLSLPYSNFSSSQQQQQQIYSPMRLAVPTPQQQQQAAPAFPPATCSSDYPAAATALSEIPYLPLPRAADDTLAWEPPSASTAMFSRQTAPPTPEDFAYSLGPSQAAETRGQQQQQQQQPAKSEAAQQAYQPLIHDDENDDAEPEGEILYGMGLYDAPDHGKQESAALHRHQAVVLSLLGGVRDHKEQEDVVDTGKGLGLKLEDAWEPPASEDEDEDENEDEDEEDEDDDGEGQED